MKERNGLTLSRSGSKVLTACRAAERPVRTLNPDRETLIHFCYKPPKSLRIFNRIGNSQISRGLKETSTN